MFRCSSTLFSAVGSLLLVAFSSECAGDFQRDVRPFLQKYCLQCHSGAEMNGGVDLGLLISTVDVAGSFETWESVVEHLKAGTMPPSDEPQPSQDELEAVFAWYRMLIGSVEAKPAILKPRRLSVVEYRNTLRSVFGFDLEVAIIEAEQTLSEKSLVIKLLPTDPPGKSGFKNDTHANPLTTVVWDQYSYLIDAAIEQLFSDARRSQLEAFVGPVKGDQLTSIQASQLLRQIIVRVRRRTVPTNEMDRLLAKLEGKQDTALVDAVKFEIKAALMSPQFIYRSLLSTGEPGQRQSVDDFELAERLSYFFWGDMPDQQLLSLAESETLTDPHTFVSEVDRLLASPKARYLTDVFANEWLTLNEIETVSDDVPKMVALKSQPLDFMNYLFTEQRPLLELVDSRTEFINPHTSRMYGRDARQMSKYVKLKGIEVEIVPNQKIALDETIERGGILTMPGILAMNKGPILRGTWMLERILGQELPDPPANVGQVPSNKKGESLSFRDRFEQHRSNPTCAVCHDKIDPLGFALQGFDNSGEYLSGANQTANKKANRKDVASEAVSAIDTSGRLPSGESFNDIEELKKILATSQREAVIRNIVKRTMSFALCRKLEIDDRPTLDKIATEMNQTNGTWRDLFLAVATSIPFRETILSETE